MTIRVSEEPITSTAEYARVPIAFEVSEAFDVVAEQGSTTFKLTERRLDKPYLKDYDTISQEGPTAWARRFNVSNWGLFAARIEDRLVGGAVVAYDTPELHMLEGRKDLAVLWDIRVVPSMGRHGAGSLLFRAAESWARTRGCGSLKVETQNINVAACRFYARQGCLIRAANPGAYLEYPDEIQLLWYKDLG